MSRGPLIIAGMHRSGTSLTASMAVDLGVDVGDELLAADRNNAAGYFEDVRFLTFQRELLLECTRADDGGHRDWGWTESGWLDERRFADFRPAARELLEARQPGPRPWGWKDPRSTLLLDFWGDLSPDARFLLVYRYPWDVAESMQRLAAPVFLENPEYAFRIWAFYNRRLLDAFHRHRDRAVLVSVNALVHEPEELGRLLRSRLGLEVTGARAAARIDPDRLRTVDGDDPLVSLTAATSPECTDLLAELDGAADLPASGRWTPRRLEAVRRIVDQPVVSVLTACRDHGQLLVDAVASVERCAPGSELVVVDDGSTQPRTLEILDLLRRAGYTVIRQEPAGLAAARNRAVAASRGRYLLPLDSDNRLRPGFVPQAVRVLDERPEVGVVYGDRHEFGMRSGDVGVPEHDPERILWGNYIDACAVLRREVWEEAGGFDPGVDAWSDWSLWVDATLGGWSFHRLEGITFDYRVRPNSMVWQTLDLGNAGPMIGRLLERHREAYLPRIEARIGNLVSWPRWLEQRAAARADDGAASHAAGGEPVAVLLDAQRTELRRRSAALSREQSRRENVEAELAAARTELATAQDELVALRAQLSSAQDELVALRAEQQRTLAALASSEADGRSLADELERRSDELDESRRELARSERQLRLITSTRGYGILAWYWSAVGPMVRRLRDRVPRRHG